MPYKNREDRIAKRREYYKDGRYKESHRIYFRKYQRWWRDRKRRAFKENGIFKVIKDVELVFVSGVLAVKDKDEYKKRKAFEYQRRKKEGYYEKKKLKRAA